MQAPTETISETIANARRVRDMTAPRCLTKDVAAATRAPGLEQSTPAKVKLR